MSKKEAIRFTEDIIAYGTSTAIGGMLAKVNSSKSTSFLPQDATAIHSTVKELIVGGFTTLDSMILGVWQDWLVRLIRARTVSASSETEKFWCMSALASVYKFQGKYFDAEPLAKRLVEICRSFYGEDSEFTLQSTCDLCDLWILMGKHENAEPLCTACMETARREFGPDHALILDSTSQLAGLYCSQGKYDDSEQLFREWLRISETMRDVGEEQKLIILHQLADV
jgi:tetratricopeptide (TPR) repeat protein